MRPGHGRVLEVLPRRSGPEGDRREDHRHHRGGTQTARLDNYALERTTRHWVSLAYGDDLTPTLTLTSHPGEKADGKPILLDQVGISHISFGVADVAGLADELEAKGFPLAGSRESYTDANGNIKSIYVRDPDGILVQFNTP